MQIKRFIYVLIVSIVTFFSFVNNSYAVSSFDRIEGYVLNATNGEPLKGVEVNILGRGEFDVTDDDGFFLIQFSQKFSDNTVLRILFQKKDFKAAELRINANNPRPLIIKLEANDTTLPILRMGYIVCTGPYNQREWYFVGNTDRNSTPQHYLVNNTVLKTIERLGILAVKERGVMTVVELLKEKQIDSIVGINNTSLRNYSAEQKARYKLERYYTFFNSQTIDIEFLKKYKLLPDSFETILFHNPTYNEVVDAIIAKSYHNWSISATFYLRSFRTKIVYIENISDKILSNISFQVKAYIPKNPFELRQGKRRNLSDVDYLEQTLDFPLAFLKPGEKVAFPLELKLVPAHYASGYIYESAMSRDELNLIGDRENHLFNQLFIKQLEYDQKDLLPKAYIGSIISEYGIVSSNTTPEELRELSISPDDSLVIRVSESNKAAEAFDIGPSYRLQQVSFNIANEPQVQTYYREFSPEDTLYVNDNCQCGSCPVLFAQNSSGNWRRLQEIITNNRSQERANDFVVEIPKSSEKIRIEEYKSETTLLSALEIFAITEKGEVYKASIHQLYSDPITITYNLPLTVDLSLFHEKLEDIDMLYMKGKGYYETDSKIVCPFVLPLNHDYFE